MDWLSGWAKRRQIIIDHTKIDSALTNFPILLYLSASSGINGADLTSIFDEVGSNRKKIAVTLADGVTQCYVEIEKWDAVNKKAWLWVKVPSISSTSDTILYIYYDNTQPDNTTYVGDPGETPAQNVWDANFVLVTHMRDDPDSSHIRDSTSNANNGTKTAAGEPAVTAGKIDDAQNFDGANDEISIPDSPSLHLSDGMTLLAWIKADTWESPNNVPIIDKWYDGTHRAYLMWAVSGGELQIGIANSAGGAQIEGVTTGMDMATGTWYLVAVVWSTSLGTAKVYKNGAWVEDMGTGSDTIYPNTDDVDIGQDYNGEDNFDGIIDEVRISNIARSAAWIKATYETGIDDLLTWGSEETPAPLLIHRLPARIPARNPIYKVPS